MYLIQVDLYAKKNDLSIVGWYHGNARNEDNALPERAIKVTETIKRNNQDKAIIFLINNKQFTHLEADESAITVSRCRAMSRVYIIILILYNTNSLLCMQTINGERSKNPLLAATRKLHWAKKIHIPKFAAYSAAVHTIESMISMSM